MGLRNERANIFLKAFNASPYPDNFNALHIAAMFSREDVVKLLLAKKGVDVYAPGGARQQTAVHLVASRQTGTATSILRVLLAAGGKEIRIRPDGTRCKSSRQYVTVSCHRGNIWWLEGTTGG
ncbi:hypothetical protein J6590_018466 [Homalodisca vitripennis]|nr:hypothetical protein J6590_018466 [Homalodisca vitripennis]